MERNFETVMIEQCAPVLASLKPAGLFRYETSDCADLARRVLQSLERRPSQTPQRAGRVCISLPKSRVS